tara:strand:- start:1392 stop:1736 length:345 start_codon:yes stop_codon:yes gene_type:complete
MKSFIIIDQHGETIAGFDSNNHAVSFLASYKKREENDQCSITLRGTDLDSNKEQTWLKRELKNGERIVLEFINTNELSVAPATVQESLTTKEINEQKLKYFFTLKKELEEAGLI